MSMYFSSEIFLLGFRFQLIVITNKLFVHLTSLYIVTILVCA